MRTGQYFNFISCLRENDISERNEINAFSTTIQCTRIHKKFIIVKCEWQMFVIFVRIVNLKKTWINDGVTVISIKRKMIKIF